MVKHRFGRAWAYRVPNKDIPKGASWLPKRLMQDLDNTGLQDVRVSVESDQVPAMVDVQFAMQEARPNMVVPINSPVGESESNGRVENTIRRVQEKIRALRHHAEHKTGVRIFGQSPVMVWLSCWAAALISKYSRGDDGKSPHERIRGEPSRMPLVLFGEKVLFLPMKIEGAEGRTS